MGRATAEVTISNIGDLYEARAGHILNEQVRRVILSDAIVDTDASTLALPADVIRRLGLNRWSSTQNRLEPVRIEIMGRNTVADPIEAPEGSPVVIGRIILHSLDWVVDSGGQKLIGNPAHGGEHIIEMY